ncbi:MAG: hypothetical protein K0Q66_1117, partial [Chitinophagaceae bacterium]|nr:hypothetical protein [Chitinophagaceae bacterium]
MMNLRRCILRYESKKLNNMKKLVLLLIFFAAVAVHAQHEHHAPPKSTTKKAPAKTTKTKKAAPAKAPAKDTAHKKMTPKDSAHRHGKDSVQAKTHTHVLGDSMTVVHDENHNELKDTSKPHDHHTMVDTVKVHHHGQVDTLAAHGDHAATGHEGHDMSNMSHAFSLHLPMNRNGSGTGWLPDASPMYGYMFHTPKWMYMLHGNVFLRYTSQDFTNRGSRGGNKVDVPNWVMFMGQRKVGANGLFHFSTMFSLDAAIAGGSGYPLLFQSGEAYQGKALVDRQHPHDFFSELAVSYSHSLSKNADVFAYLGYPGEPALGPVAFMHRPSALYNPDAPISHHWIDATHITFGVATIGVRLGQFKLEGSSFTGREPNEKRFDFDKPRFDSWSSRLSFNPSKHWALQVSHGFLESPEELHPGEDVSKTTASVVYSKPLMNESWVNAAAVWGMNKVKHHEGEQAFLLEGAWNKGKVAVHGRYEFVEKSVEELLLDET